MRRMLPMGLLGLLLAAGLSVTNAANPGYQDVLDAPASHSKLPALAPLMAVTAASPQTLIAVGRRGHILVSKNAGKDWRQSDVPVSTDLVAVHFPDALNGWAVGHDGVVLHTADGGRSWLRQLDGREAAKRMVARATAVVRDGDEVSQRTLAEAKRFQKEGPGRPFLDVWFDDDKTGYIVGIFNMILRTADGGKTWESWSDRVENPEALHLNAIRAVDGELYIVGEQGLILRLDREQQKFVRLPSPYTGSFFGVTGKAGLLAVYGLRGNAFISRDRGTNWQALRTDVNTSLTGGAVMADGRLVLVSQAGQLLISTADATSAKQFDVVRPMPAYGVAVFGDKQIAIAGARGVQIQTLNHP